MKRLVLLVAIAACSKSSDKAPAAQPAAAQPAPPAAAEPAKHEDRADPAVAAPPLSLAVKVDGTATTWTQDRFDRVPKVQGKASSGETRDTWSLRDLAHAEVGPHARVVAVVGDVRKEIDAAAWADATRTPIIHRTKRGALKFRWADKDGQWGDTEVKDVTGLELAR